MKLRLFDRHPTIKSDQPRIGSASFEDSKQYWEDRYRRGGNSGDGSYGALSQYKADVLNDFVLQNNVRTVVEFGAGDGNQLQLFSPPNRYVGLDVSSTAVSCLRSRFRGENAFEFREYETGCLDHDLRGAFDLAISLDVLFHLVEIDVFRSYMKDLFDSATRFVIIYSSDFDKPSTSPHVVRRSFTQFVAENMPNWSLLRVVDNPHKPQTMSDFHVFECQES